MHVIASFVLVGRNIVLKPKQYFCAFLHVFLNYFSTQYQQNLEQQSLLFTIYIYICIYIYIIYIDYLEVFLSCFNIRHIVTTSDVGVLPFSPTWGPIIDVGNKQSVATALWHTLVVNVPWHRAQRIVCSYICNGPCLEAVGKNCLKYAL